MNNDPSHDVAGAGNTELDRLIAEAERTVVQRDLRVRQRVDTISRRARSTAVAGVGQGLLMALGAALFSALLPRRRRVAHGAPRRPRSRGVPWARLLPLAWPLMPPAVRLRIGPAAAAALFSVGLPLLANLFRRRDAPEKVERVDQGERSM